MTNRGRPLPVQIRQDIWRMGSMKIPKIQIARSLGLSNKTVIKYLRNKFTQPLGSTG